MVPLLIVQPLCDYRRQRIPIQPVVSFEDALLHREIIDLGDGPKFRAIAKQQFDRSALARAALVNPCRRFFVVPAKATLFQPHGMVLFVLVRRR